MPKEVVCPAPAPARRGGVLDLGNCPVLSLS
jgi:hypothetical protein